MVGEGYGVSCCVCPGAWSGGQEHASQTRSVVDVQDREDGKWHVYDDVSVEPWDVANLDQDCFGGRYVSDTNNRVS